MVNAIFTFLKCFEVKEALSHIILEEFVGVGVIIRMLDTWEIQFRWVSGSPR